LARLFAVGIVVVECRPAMKGSSDRDACDE
jgi:hypothetical protein